MRIFIRRAVPGRRRRADASGHPSRPTVRGGGRKVMWAAWARPLGGEWEQIVRAVYVDDVWDIAMSDPRLAVDLLVIPEKCGNPNKPLRLAA